MAESISLAKQVVYLAPGSHCFLSWPPSFIRLRQDGTKSPGCRGNCHHDMSAMNKCLAQMSIATCSSFAHRSTPRSLECRKPLPLSLPDLGLHGDRPATREGENRALSPVRVPRPVSETGRPLRGWPRPLAWVAPGPFQRTGGHAAMASPMVPRAHGGEAMSAETPMDCGLRLASCGG